MRFFDHHRRLLSTVALFAFVLGLGASATPAAAEYNPKLGRFMQRDPNGTGLVFSPGLRYHGSNPIVTVSLAYELQYGDGMNFYEFLRSNAVNRRDPSGLFTLADTLVTAGITGGLYGLANDYSQFNDKGSNWRLAAGFAKGAGLGTGAAVGFGLLAGALAGYAGISIGAASASIGLITSPAILGMSVKEFQDAETYADRVMAAIDIGGAGLGIIASHMAAFKFVGGAGSANPFQAIRTFRGLAKQEMSPAALALRARVERGQTLWRYGTTGRNDVQRPHFWSTEHPSSPGFAERHGIPPQNVAKADFIESGVLTRRAKFITRTAENGTALEVVVQRGGVRLESVSVTGP